MTAAHKHGDERNFRQVTSASEPQEFIAGGESLRMSVVSETRPEGERYCAACGEWKQQVGILAAVFGCPDCGKDWCP